MLLGIDLGTGSAKALLLATDGTAIGEASSSYPVHAPHPGWAESEPAVKIERFDHLVRTVHDIDRTCDFYTRVLGMKAIAFQEGRTALQFGQQKLNLHAVRKEFEPKARNPTPGSANLCLITEISLDEVI